MLSNDQQTLKATLDPQTELEERLGFLQQTAEMEEKKLKSISMMQNPYFIQAQSQNEIITKSIVVFAFQNNHLID